MNLLERMFSGIFDKGYEAGYTKRCMEDHEAQNRRLEQMLKYGKELGHRDGYVEGYMKGYEIGYAEGEYDTKDGVIELEDLIDDVDEALEGCDTE